MAKIRSALLDVEKNLKIAKIELEYFDKEHTDDENELDAVKNEKLTPDQPCVNIYTANKLAVDAPQSFYLGLLAEQEEWDEWKANAEKKLSDAKDHLTRCWNQDVKDQDLKR